MWLSISAESRLCAVVMAWKSPVKWRFGRDADLGADLLDLFLLGGARDLDVGLHFGHDGFPLDWAVEGTVLINCACLERRTGAGTFSNPVAAAASTFMQLCFL